VGQEQRADREPGGQMDQRGVGDEGHSASNCARAWLTGDPKQQAGVQPNQRVSVGMRRSLLFRPPEHQLDQGQVLGMGHHVDVVIRL
jgi:hypothetical protein